MKDPASLLQSYLEACAENVDLKQQIFQLKRQLDIATRALDQISCSLTKDGQTAYLALERILT